MLAPPAPRSYVVGERVGFALVVCECVWEMGTASTVCCCLSGGPRGQSSTLLFGVVGFMHGGGADSRHVAGDQLECGSLSSSGEQGLGF